MKVPLKVRNKLLHAEMWIRLSNKVCPDSISLLGAYDAISLLVTHLRSLEGPFRRNHRSDCHHCKQIREKVEAMEDLEEKIITYAVTNLTKRQIEVLRLLRDGKDLVREGLTVYVGDNRTNVLTVTRLLQTCAVKLEDGSVVGKFERYLINSTGREILRRKGI